MLSQKRYDGYFTTVMVLTTMCTVMCISNHVLRSEAFALASINPTTRKGFSGNRYLARDRLSSLFSMEPTSNSPPPPVAPTANVINGASSTEASFDASVNGIATAEISDSKTNTQLASLLGKFRQVSNFASFLCVLDCTLLPIITVALPLLGVLNLGAGQLKAIDKLGHSLALYFVLPVGSLTTFINYISHKKKKIAALAILGLTMVGLANSHTHIHHWPTIGSFSLDWIGSILHKIQGCGTSPWHRIVNVSGCGFLLGSNYWSQKQDGCAAHEISGSGECCGHDHDH